MKIAFSLCLLVFTSFVCAQCRESSEGDKGLATDQSAINFARDFYREHYYFYSDPQPERVDQLYSDEFKQVITDHAECVRDNGICNIDFDPWLYAQDGYADGDIDYSVRYINSNTLAVDLNYQFRVHPTLPSKPQKVSLLLKKVDNPLCWKLDDVLLPDRSSMKEMMKNDYEHFYYFRKTQLSWKLLSVDMDSSNIQVIRDKQVIAEYVLNCDVSESLNVDPQQLEGEMNTVGLIVTPFKPQGLLITSCRVGAHSKQLSVYDLASKRRDPEWEKTGSYFGEWSVNQGFDLVLSYDEPCYEQECDAPFVQREFVWGEGASLEENPDS